jgi:hypothetical protein
MSRETIINVNIMNFSNWQQSFKSRDLLSPTISCNYNTAKMIELEMYFFKQYYKVTGASGIHSKIL